METRAFRIGVVLDPERGNLNAVFLVIFKDSSSSSSSFEEHPLQVRHKQDWGRGFILLLIQTAALPESDAGSGVIKPASSFVIQKPSKLVIHVVPDV